MYPFQSPGAVGHWPGVHGTVSSYCRGFVSVAESMYPSQKAWSVRIQWLRGKRLGMCGGSVKACVWQQHGPVQGHASFPV